VAAPLTRRPDPDEVRHEPDELSIDVVVLLTEAFLCPA